MAFNEPSQDQLEQYRDEAEKNHRAYWAENGGSPNPDSYFPGFERGWHDAIDALKAGNDFQDDQLADWAHRRAQETGQGDDAWEWEHGFKQGALKAREAGQQ